MHAADAIEERQWLQQVAIGTLLTLARDLQLRVIAEGIERGDQLSFMRSHGCQEGQGSLFSEAPTAADVEAFRLNDAAN